MKTTITAVLLCVLGALGILNIGQSIRNHFFGSHDETTSTVAVRSDTEAAADEVMIDQRFKVSAGDLLELAISHADVDVVTTDRMEAHVRVLVSASDMDRAREFFESRNFEVRQDGRRIIVRTNPQRNWSWSSGRVQMDVEIAIPSRFDAEITMSHGDLDLASLEGSVALKSSHGDVDVAGVDGEFLKVKHSHGDLAFGRVRVDRADLLNSHGELDIEQLYADRIEAKSSHGDMQLGIKEAAELDLTNSHGLVEIYMSSGIGGTIRNSHGDIDIETTDDAAMTLDLEGSHISLDRSMTFSGSNTSKRVEGMLNGGGPLLKARTSFGSIEIHS